LKLATAQAKSNADAMASGLDSIPAPQSRFNKAARQLQRRFFWVAATASATTPVETGVVNVQASVTLDVALVP
jgi:uncharacterized protein YggE